jgi:hypothetical protein
MLGILRHDHSQAKQMLLLLFVVRPGRTCPATRYGGERTRKWFNLRTGRLGST